MSAITPACALGGAEHLQRRQPADDVEEVAREALQDPELSRGPVPRGCAHQRHEHRDQRQREQHYRGRDPVAGGQRDDDRQRHDHRQQNLGQIQREVVVQRIDPACGERRERAGALSTDSRRPELGHPSQQRTAKLGLCPSRRAAGSELGAPRHRRARTHDHQQRHDRPAKLREPATRERVGHHARQQPGLGDHQQRSDRPEPDRRGDEWSGRTGVAQQAWVDRASTRSLAARPFLPHDRSPPAAAGAHIMRIG